MTRRRTIRAPKGFPLLNALGETMFLLEGDLVALRAPEHRARPAMVVGRHTVRSGRAVWVRGYTRHGIAHRTVKAVPGAAVLGFWQ